MSASFGTQRAVEPPTFMQTALRPLAERQTYLDIVYLLLSFPLGLFGFVCMVTMLSLAAGLTVTIVGLPVMVVTLTTARWMAGWIGALTGRLLGTGALPRRDSPPAPSGLRGAVRRLGDRRAWRDAAFLLLLFPIGVVNFTIVTSLLGASLWMMEQPILVLAHVHTQVGDHWVIDSVPKALLFPLPGLLLGFGALHLMAPLAAVSRRFTLWMLARVDYPALRVATARTLTGRELTGPAIVDELRRFIGCSPDFTAMKVYATLTALEDQGLVTSADSGGLTRYSLTLRGERALAEI